MAIERVTSNITEKASFFKKASPYVEKISISLVAYVTFSYFHYLTLRNRQERLTQYVKDFGSISTESVKPLQRRMSIENWELFFPGTHQLRQTDYEGQSLRLNLVLDLKHKKEVICEDANTKEIFKTFIHNPEHPDIVKGLKDVFKQLKIVLVSNKFEVDTLQSLFSDSKIVNFIILLDLYYNYKCQQLSCEKDQAFFNDLQSFLKRFSPHTSSFYLLVLQVQATFPLSYYALEKPFEEEKLISKPNFNYTDQSMTESPTVGNDWWNTILDIYSEHDNNCNRLVSSDTGTPQITPPHTPLRVAPQVLERPIKGTSSMKSKVIDEQVNRLMYLESLHDSFTSYLDSVKISSLEPQDEYSLDINLVATKLFEEFYFEKIFPKPESFCLKDLFSTKENQEQVLACLRKVCKYPSPNQKAILLDFILTLQGACPLIVQNNQEFLPLAAILHNIESPIEALSFFLPVFQSGSYDLYSKDLVTIGRGKHKHQGYHHCVLEDLDPYLPNEG